MLLLLLFSAIAYTCLAQDVRHFTFHYAFSVKNLPPQKKIRIWIPAAQSDAYQEVRILSVKGDLPLKEFHEAKYGNEIYYAETSGVAKPELHFDVECDVVRHERIALGATQRVSPVVLSSQEKQEDLQPDALVPTSGLPAELAVKVTQGKTAPH